MNRNQTCKTFASTVTPKSYRHEKQKKKEEEKEEKEEMLDLTHFP